MGIPRQHIRLRRALAVDWPNTNPILAEAELGLESDTGLLKVGDGVTPWTGLGYINVGANFNQINRLGDLLDVSDSSKVDESVLVYDNALNKWVGGSEWTVKEIVDGGNF